MKKSILLTLGLSLGTLFSGAQSTCNDRNGYPQSKNTGLTGAYTLMTGAEERAAQTYHYNGPGRLTGVRIYGSTPNTLTGVQLRVSVYSVDANDRPAVELGSRTVNWNWWDNQAGYKDVTFIHVVSGVDINSNFAVAIEVVNGIPQWTQFQLEYNGNGEGLGEDLASLAGTSTGFNWTSAMTGFSKDGDFYIVPRMRHVIDPDFTASTVCTSVNTPVSFNNLSSMTLDSMFNKIGLAAYSGSASFYAWDFGDGSPVSNAVNPVHSYTAAGVYTVSLTCTIEGWNNTCTETKTMQVSVGLAGALSASANVSCNGESDGSFTVSATGGAAPYTYSMNGAEYQSGASFSSLAAGVYTAYVKDNLGCVATTTVNITQPGAIVFTTPTTTNASCGNSDGALQVTAGGGSGALQYSINGTTWQGNGNYINLPAGGYTIQVKDANGCTNEIAVTVNDFGGPAMTINSMTHVSCSNGNDGSLVVSATGGSGTLQYSIDGVNFQQSGTFTGLGAGTYFVTVKDAAGCSDIKTAVINQPAALNFSVTTVKALCNGSATGQINVTNVTGGTGTMSYSLNGTTWQSGTYFSGLSAGTYTVYTKDVTGCIATKQVTVAEPAALSLNLSAFNPSCYTSTDGAVIASGTGGSPRYRYSINGGAFSPSGDFSDLIAGTYTITVQDGNSCQYSNTITITDPAQITVTIAAGNSTCGNDNGTLLVAAAGGSGSGFQYSIDGSNWNTSGSFSNLADSTYFIVVQDGSGCNNLFHSTITDANGPVINTVSSTNVTCFGEDNGTISITNVTGGSGTLNYGVDGSPWQTATSFTGLTAGSHTVTVKDGLGCSGSYIITLTEPAAIMVTTTPANVSCFGGSNGSVNISAGGGSGTLAYSTNGNNYQSSNTIGNLPAGTYTAYVRDAGGCVGTTSFVITQPPAITIAGMGVLNVSCNGANDGAVMIGANGGTGTLQYSVNGSNYQNLGFFPGLGGAIYTVYVKDANGCIATTTAIVNEPLPVSVSYSLYNISCAGGNDGVIDLTVTGGVAPYFYSWSNGVTTEDNFNLPAGNYNVVVTDANLCSYAAAYSITQPANPLIVNAVISNATGLGNADGSIDVTITGGTAPYSYSWSNGATTQDLSGVLPGSYIVTITDANGCITTGVYNVTAPTGTEAIAVSPNAIKVYPNPASGFVTVDGGSLLVERVEMFNIIGELVYSEEPKQLKTNLNISGLAEGLYFLKIKTGNSYVTKRLDVYKR